MTLVYHNFELPQARLEVYRSAYESHSLRLSTELDEQTLKEAKYLINQSEYIDDDLIRHFAQLKAIVVCSTESWMVDLSTEDIPVITLEEDRGYDVAEHAVALLLATIKKLNRLQSGDPLVRLKRFLLHPLPRLATETVGAFNWRALKTGTLYNRRIGIVGYGLIGRGIHKRLSGFDVQVAYYDQHRYPQHLEAQLGIEFLDLEAIFRRSDYIFLQLPLTPRTERLISRDLLTCCKPELVLVNCGRAAVVDEESLYLALRERRLQYYAADVFWREPMPIWSRFRFRGNC